jgi:hypothetical protein
MWCIKYTFLGKEEIREHRVCYLGSMISYRRLVYKSAYPQVAYRLLRVEKRVGKKRENPS